MTFNEEIKELLLGELKVLKELLTYSLEKTDLIVENDVKRIEELTLKEEALINKLGEIEVNRGNLLDSWGVSDNTPISEILGKIPENKEELISIKDEMYDVMQELSARNKANAMLLNDSLEWIDFNMNLFTNARVEPNYGKTSQNVKSGNSLFDRKV